MVRLNKKLDPLRTGHDAVQMPAYVMSGMIADPTDRCFAKAQR